VIATGSLDPVLAVLHERVSSENVRPLGSAVLLHTELKPADLRDWLSAALGEGQSLFVVEFEKWSSYGADVDTVWLLERGH
jgi:hypothetical protein